MTTIEHQIADPVERVNRISPATSPEFMRGVMASVSYLGRPTAAHSEVVASWSGGIDSTAVVAHLCARGYDVLAITLGIYGQNFGQRERRARELLKPELEILAMEAGGALRYMEEKESGWIWAFSPDGIEIPRRNKHIIDRLCDHYARRYTTTRNIALGEYTGADTWLVRDHVAASDADHRSLASYLYAEYGMSWRLLSLQDFGESRYKVDRARLLGAVLGDAAFDTSVCLVDSAEHCGECYKCVERHAAFLLALGRDRTPYMRDPKLHPFYQHYCQQMRGHNITVPRDNFPTTAPMPERPDVSSV
jgi:hypothetical protein